MKRVAVIGASIVVAAMVGAAGAAPRKAAGVPLAPQSVVEARRAAMMLSATTYGSLRAQMTAEDLKRAVRPAQALNAWAKAIPAMFPAGTDVPPTDALQAIWSDRAGFDGAAQSFVSATDGLAKAAAANDKTAYAAAIEQTGKACSACHDKYRKAEEKH